MHKYDSPKNCGLVQDFLKPIEKPIHIATVLSTLLCVFQGQKRQENSNKIPRSKVIGGWGHAKNDGKRLCRVGFHLPVALGLEKLKNPQFSWSILSRCDYGFGKTCIWNCFKSIGR